MFLSCLNDETLSGQIPHHHPHMPHVVPVVSAPPPPPPPASAVFPPAVQQTTTASNGGGGSGGNQPAQQMITAGTKKDCIRLRGLPYEAQVKHILDFLGEDLSNNIVTQGVHMVINAQVSVFFYLH